MSKKKVAGIALILVGIAIIILMLIADQIGLGTPEHGFGLRQKAATIVGAIIFIVGLVMTFKK